MAIGVRDSAAGLRWDLGLGLAVRPRTVLALVVLPLVVDGSIDRDSCWASCVFDGNVQTSHKVDSA